VCVCVCVCVCVSSHLLPCRPRSGAWDAAKGLPDGVPAKKVRTAEEKDSVLSLLSSGEVDHDHASFLFNKVALSVTDTVCWLSRDRLYKRPLSVVHNYVKRVYKKLTVNHEVAWWRNGRASDLRSRGREFDPRPGRGCVRRLWASCSHPVASTLTLFVSIIESLNWVPLLFSQWLLALTRVQDWGDEPPNGVGCGRGLKRIGGVL